MNEAMEYFENCRIKYLCMLTQTTEQKRDTAASILIFCFFIHLSQGPDLMVQQYR